jgi:ribosome biogenesis GTPase
VVAFKRHDGLGSHRTPRGPAPPRRPGALRLTGTVTEVSGRLSRVYTEQGLLLCGLRGMVQAGSAGFTGALAAGDEVTVTPNGAGGGIVESIAPRRSMLVRPDVHLGHRQQVLVANADQLMVVAAWRDPPMWPELVDRYLITAQRFGLEPVICMNKSDLAPAIEECMADLAPYAAAGYRVLVTSVTTGQGMEELRTILEGKVTILAGLSGVGKSSLLTALQPDLQLRTGAIADYHMGRHTTSRARLYPLDGGGYVADTPGVREFGLYGLTRAELADYYPEMKSLAGACRYPNCAHLDEERCAVRLAAESREISDERYASYQKIWWSLKE